MTGIVAALAFFMITLVVSHRTGRMASEEAVRLAREIAYHNGLELSAKIADALSMARTLARTLEAGIRMRDKIDRSVYDAFFIETIEKSDDFYFGAWAVFEPGKFDGRDREFAGKPGYGKNGDYIPFAYRKDGRIVFKHDVYEDDKDSDYYTIPRKSKQECVIDPYIDPDAENVVMASVAVPVMESGEVVAVAGIDMLLSSINLAVSKIRPFQRGYIFMAGSNGFIVGHPRDDMIGKKISGLGVSKSVIDAMNNGQEAIEQRRDELTGEDTLFVYVPVKIGSAHSHWSTCVAIPTDVIMEKSRSITFLTAMVGVAAMSILVLTLFVLARNVIVPLRQSEEKIRRAFDNVHAAVIIQDSNGNILDVNEQMLTLYGITRDELAGYSFRDGLSAHDNQFELLPALWERTLSGQPQELTWRSMRPKKGEVFETEVFLDRMEFLGTAVIVATIRDVTERKKIEAEQLKTTKLESLGTLAGGIAHDFNNFLMGITGNLMLAKKRLSPGDKLYELLTRAENVAFKAKALAEQLITFSKGGLPIKTLSSINDLLENTVQFATVGTAVKCVFTLAPELPPVEFDEGQIAQVITNIVINAKQAMGGEGTIEVRTQSAEAGDHPGTDGRKYVKISIKDDGCGIPPGVLPKIFDPYFTTKPDGSGLGLSTSYSIVKNHNGFMNVDSSEGYGTTFEIFLPLSDSQGKNAMETALKEYSGKGRRILLMDDDETVLIPVCEILNGLHYEVVPAKDGTDAIETYVKYLSEGKPFDAVILDLVVCGGVGGLETMKRLKAIDPEIKAIVSSGYSNDQVMADYRKYGFCGVLVKPYHFGEMSQLLFELITKK